MRKLTSIKDNIFTSKLLDVIMSNDSEEPDSYLFIVMEYVEHDLKKLLQASNKMFEFSEDHVVTIMYNCLCALKFLHSANIMHRDIKPANLLVDGSCQVKICDFGLSRTVPTKQISV